MRARCRSEPVVWRGRAKVEARLARFDSCLFMREVGRVPLLTADRTGRAVSLPQAFGGQSRLSGLLPLLGRGRGCNHILEPSGS